MSDAPENMQPDEVLAEEYDEWQAWIEDTLRHSGAMPEADMDEYFSALHDAQTAPHPDTGSQPSHGPDIEP